MNDIAIKTEFRMTTVGAERRNGQSERDITVTTKCMNV